MNSIAKVALPISLDKEFDYLLPKGLAVEKGMRVLVDFRGRKRVGVVTGVQGESKVKKLKPIVTALDVRPLLGNESFYFAKKLTQLYPYCLGEFLFMMIPAYLRKPYQNRLADFSEAQVKNNSTSRIFVKSLNILDRYQYWKDLIKEKLKQGSVVVCLPQSSYLQRVKQLLSKDFPSQVKVLHSQKTEKEFFLDWQNSRKRSLILGMRMALFYYPSDLALIIIEEEDSPYYFHEEKPFYSLGDVATLLSAVKGADLVLAGDYPSLVTYKYIEEKKIKLLEIKPESKKVQLVNLSGFSKKKLIGPVIVELITKAMKGNKKVVILGNKKAIERRTSLLKRIFPEVKVNSWQRRSLNSRIVLSSPEILSSLYRQEVFDLGFLLDCDWLLSRPDYQVTFNSFLYIKKLGSFFRNPIYLFTSNQGYYLFDYLNRNWKQFYKKELRLRKEMGLPPFKLLAKITLRSKNENLLLKQAQDLYNRFKESFPEVYGPAEEYPFKLRNKFRYSITVKTENNLGKRAIIKAKIDHIRRSKLQLAAELH